MKHAIRVGIALASLCLCTSAGATIVTFEIPGAWLVLPVAINANGAVTGQYNDSNGSHGFLWQADGRVVTFDVPGAVNTIPVGINAGGVITGLCDGQQVHSGFVRAADGSFTTFNVPDGDITVPQRTNKKGWIVGYYYRGSSSKRPHAFLRDPSGRTKEFYVPDGHGAIASVVNNSQTVAGEVLLGNGDTRLGFIRKVDGTAKMFGDPQFSYDVVGINDAGTITGSVYSSHSEGFVRTSDGVITTFTAPNGPKQTYPLAMNNAGTIVGTFTDSSNVVHGFLRKAGGTFTSFDPQNSVYTWITAITNKGTIAGTYTDKDGVIFGFTGTP